VIIVNNISVIGLGYIGLPTAVLFANRGFRVIGVDIDVSKVEAISNGKCYIHEAGLAKMISDTVSNGFLRATTDAVGAVKWSDAVIIAVPTPVRDGVADLSYLRNTLESIMKGLHKGLLVVIESTVPPGTTIRLVKPLLEESGLRVEEDFYLAHVPERIAPGRAIEELLNMPRVVGGVGPRSTEKALKLYGKVNPKLYPTDATTAEFVKLIENTYRDLNIAYANILAIMAEKLGIDVYEAINLANTHQRVNIHMPGAGVGGPCLTKDPYMLTSIAPEFWGTELIKLARRINDYMPKHTVNIVEKALTDAGLSMKDARVAVLGAAYKGGVDDVRESPAKHIIKELLNRGAKVIIYDPYTDECFEAERALSLEDAVKDVDIILIVTDHPEFKNLDLNIVGNLVRHRIIVDGRRIIDPYQAIKYGFRYYGIGYGRRSNYEHSCGCGY
jgi:UDP-N-acetyl-D-mannosaminuronic acid dehydrogenase